MTRTIARRVLELEARAILDLVPRLGEAFDRAVETLFACKGRVVVTGMGKSGLIGGKIAATFSSTGTPTSDRTAFRIRRPSSIPGPRNDSIELRLALSNEDLKTYGTERSRAIAERARAMRRA